MLTNAEMEFQSGTIQQGKRKVFMEDALQRHSDVMNRQRRDMNIASQLRRNDITKDADRRRAHDDRVRADMDMELFGPQSAASRGTTITGNRYATNKSTPGRALITSRAAPGTPIGRSPLAAPVVTSSPTAAPSPARAATQPATTTRPARPQPAPRPARPQPAPKPQMSVLAQALSTIENSRDTPEMKKKAAASSTPAPRPAAASAQPRPRLFAGGQGQGVASCGGSRLPGQTYEPQTPSSTPAVRAGSSSAAGPGSHVAASAAGSASRVAYAAKSAAGEATPARRQSSGVTTTSGSALPRQTNKPHQNNKPRPQTSTSARRQSSGVTSSTAPVNTPSNRTTRTTATATTSPHPASPPHWTTDPATALPPLLSPLRSTTSPLPASPRKHWTTDPATALPPLLSPPQSPPTHTHTTNQAQPSALVAPRRRAANRPINRPTARQEPAITYAASTVLNNKRKAKPTFFPGTPAGPTRAQLDAEARENDAILAAHAQRRMEKKDAVTPAPWHGVRERKETMGAKRQRLGEWERNVGGEGRGAELRNERVAERKARTEREELDEVEEERRWMEWEQEMRGSNGGNKRKRGGEDGESPAKKMRQG